MMVQLVAKAYASEKWGVRMVWAVQDVLYNYIVKTTAVEIQEINIKDKDIESIPQDIPILLFVYSMDMNNDTGQFELHLKHVHGGTKEGFAKFLEPTELPETQKMIDLIQHGIRSKLSAFTLGQGLPNSLAESAAKMVRDSSD